MIYIVKSINDDSLILIVRHAPHGNEDIKKQLMKTDCCSYLFNGFRMVLSCASMEKWKVRKAAGKSAFLRTGAAQRDVYFLPLKGSVDRSCYWLMKTASYGIVNGNITQMNTCVT